MTPLGAIEASALGHSLRESAGLFALVKGVHLAGIAILVGSIAVLDLRLLGLARSFSVRRLAARVLPLSAGSFLLIVPSGLMMFIARAGALIASPVFALKMCLIMAAGVNAAVFHAGVFRGSARWDVGVPPPTGARAAAALSLALWISVIACGRLLAGAWRSEADARPPAATLRVHVLGPELVAAGHLGAAEGGLHGAAHLARREQRKLLDHAARG